MALSTIFLVLSLAVAASATYTQTLDFDEIPAPAPGNADSNYKATTMAYINGVPYPITYKPLLESQKTYPAFGGGTFKMGTVLDKFGVPLTAADNANADPDKLARNFDFSSIHEKFGKYWLITQDETAFGNYYLAQLNQAADGTLTVAAIKALNLGSIYGTMEVLFDAWSSSRPCSGSITPWNSHLAGEENVISAKNFPPSNPVAELVAQAVVNRLPIWSDVNPYWYSWYVEIAVTDRNGGYSVNKRWAMGRANWETAVCLGDDRTFLLTDDTSTGGIIALFVADKKCDLSCGKLYAAKPKQLNAADGGSFSIEWVPLNNGVSVCEGTVFNAVKGANYAASAVKFADLFEVMTPVAPGGVPDLTMLPAGFREVRTSGNTYEWLKLKPGMQALASVMETARMASYMGASTEWTKAEGASYDSERNEVYFALTSIRRAMLDSVVTPGVAPGLNTAEYPLSQNYIRLPVNWPGAVYRMTIDRVWGVSNKAPVSARAILNSYGYTGTYSDSVNNTVPIGSIASPDNVGFMSRYRTLLIGEDCDNQHPNNFMWAYNVDTGSIKRILYSPYEGEVTSTYYFKNIGRYSYLTGTSQHPPVPFPATVGYWTFPKER